MTSNAKYKNNLRDFILEEIESHLSKIKQILDEFQTTYTFDTSILNSVINIITSNFGNIEQEITNILNQHKKLSNPQIKPSKSEQFQKCLNSDLGASLKYYGNPSQKPQSDSLYLIPLEMQPAYLVINFGEHKISLLQKQENIDFSLAINKPKNHEQKLLILECDLVHKMKKYQIELAVNLEIDFYCKYNKLYDWKKAIAFPYYTSSVIWTLILVPSIMNSNNEKQSLMIFKLFDGKLTFLALHQLKIEVEIRKINYLKCIEPCRNNGFQWGSAILISTKEACWKLEIYVSNDQSRLEIKIGEYYNPDGCYNLQPIILEKNGNEVIIKSFKDLMLFTVWKFDLIKRGVKKRIEIKLEKFKSEEEIFKILKIGDDVYCGIITFTENQESYFRVIIFDNKTIYQDEEFTINYKFMILMTKSPDIRLLIFEPDRKKNEMNFYSVHELRITREIRSNNNYYYGIKLFSLNALIQISFDQFKIDQNEFMWLINQDLETYFDFAALEHLMES